MKITNPYYYTIDEMKQIIVEWEEMGQIIGDYKASENIEDITEEEFILLFGDSTLYPNIYWADPWEGYDYRFVSDYDWHLLESGFNPFTGELFEESEWPNCHIIEEVDTINESDVAQDLCWTEANLTFEEALAQATIMDRLYLIVDDNDNIIGSELFEVGNNINEYFKIKGLEEDFEFMKVEEPDILNEGEWECSLAEDLNYYLAIRTKTVDIYVSDISELIQMLKSEIDVTIYRQNIYYNINELNFRIKVINDEQLTYYEVEVVNKNNHDGQVLYVGCSTYPDPIPDIIEHYIKTGDSLGCC